MMPARGLRLGCRLLTLVAVGVLMPAGVKAQNSVIMRATVSEVVTLSVSPISAPTKLNVVNHGGNTVEVTLSGVDPASPIIRVPLLVRSNTSFKISAVFESKTAVLSQLSVEDVRATGKLVSPQIVSALHGKPQLDPDTSQPLLVLTGPRVSLGGTLTSPNNALEITVLIRLRPERPREPIHLTLAATPVSLIP
jgi:hypothetical protein